MNTPSSYIRSSDSSDEAAVIEVAPEAVMIEVAPHRFVNLKAARLLGLVAREREPNGR